MPDETAPSPVIPPAGSRLWSVGVPVGAAVVVPVMLAALRPSEAPYLLAGAAAVVGFSWLFRARGPAPGRSADTGDILPTEAEGAAADPLAVPDRSSSHSQPLLESLFEALDEPVLVIAGGEPDDIAGRRIVLANSAARTLFRIQREGALLVSVLRDPAVLEAVDEALFGLVGRSVTYSAGGASDRHWRALIRPLASTGEQSMAVVVLRDETDVRRMEMMRVDFLANASHELRTPLASLAGFIETLKGHAKEDPKARDKFLDIMATQTERMSRLVADLLSLSRIELNEHIPPSGRVDLARATTDVVDATSILSADKGVRVQVTPHDQPANVSGDRDEIIQVIQNLIDNAIKYSTPGQTVEVAIRPGQTLEEMAAARSGLTRGEAVTRLPLVTPDREPGVRYVAIEVRDHGPGMAREYLPRLTERFYRVEGQKSGERQGTGLGLAIVKHIVNRHRGGLSVESAPGQGATFTAYFPAAMKG